MSNNIKTFTTKSIVIGAGTPKICMPIVGKDYEEILKEIEEAKLLKPDLIEWRVDFYNDIEDMIKLLSLLKTISNLVPNMPLLLTCRHINEGGFKEVAVNIKQEIFKEAINSGYVDLIDIELQELNNGYTEIIQDAKDKKIGVILSNHFFSKTPSKKEIVKILCYEQSLGADIAKIAVMPKTSADVLSLLAATEEMYCEHAHIPLITMSMAQIGLVSRLCGGVFGSSVSFGAGLNISAPGQVGILELKDSFKLIYG